MSWTLGTMVLFGSLMSESTALLLAIVCFAIGLILCVVEMFMPGFGIAGITGVVLLLFGVLFMAKELVQGLVLLLAVIVILATMIIFSVRSFQRGKLSKSAIVLNAATDAEEGFNSAENRNDLLGLMGMALTALRPAGMAEIAGQRVDVVTEGGFIAADTPIKVTQVEGYRIIVEAVKVEN